MPNSHTSSIVKGCCTLGPSNYIYKLKNINFIFRKNKTTASEKFIQLMNLIQIVNICIKQNNHICWSKQTKERVIQDKDIATSIVAREPSVI